MAKLVFSGNVFHVDNVKIMNPDTGEMFDLPDIPQVLELPPLRRFSFYIPQAFSITLKWRFSIFDLPAIWEADKS